METGRLRALLIGALVLGTALFAIGVVLERNQEDVHGEASESHSEAEEGTEAHEEAEGAGAHEARSEELLGVDLESDALIVVALALSLVAIVLAGRARRALLIAIGLVMILFALLDVREVSHQLDESNNSIAAVAIGAAVAHTVAAVLALLLARRDRDVTKAPL